MTELFIKLPLHVSRGTGFYSPIGECIKLTLADKMVYSYMRQRNLFFKSKGLSHFESQETISREVGITRMTGIRSIQMFMKHGVIEGHKTRLDGVGRERWVYTNVHKLNTYNEYKKPVKGCIAPTIVVDTEDSNDEWAEPDW